MGSVAAPSTGTAAGTSPPTPTLGAGANDEFGTINFGTGAAPTAGNVVNFVSGSNWSGAGVTPAVGLGFSLQPTNAATAALGPWWGVWNADGRTLAIFCTGAPAASQAATVYSLSYILRG